ncbi:CRTAC1 family protein, partial [bacterium]|nr:CRTAC1 family protein [bacterium]
GIAGVSETLYTIGVTAGDWNQDGFQDLVLANIGNKVLLINNGDGTFQQREFDLDPDNKNLVSSVAMGDISGDAIPDLVSLYYVEDKEMLKRPELNEDGNVLTVSPASFVPGIDRLTINDGRGGLETRRISDSKDAASTGLGVVIADWNDQPGNEIFIGNDIRANHLWVRPELDQPWKEIAALTGCAHGYGGIATASMGIAAADFDSSGTLDLHIANFYLEPVSFFINRGGAFEDRAIQYKLHQESLSVLGFGCQAIDYNNDGKPDLAVTNGNIEKAPGEPLEQPPQFFVNLGSEFRLLDVEEPAGYWQGKYLGRGMARLDFNRDGQMDLVITHLGSPTALLLNQTDAGKNWLQVQLVGTRSERDAIGAKVSIVVDGETSTRWLVGGDGYLCRNEPTLHFGVGEATAIEKIEVTWPSGEIESFGLVEVNQRLLLIEGAGVGGLHRQR